MSATRQYGTIADAILVVHGGAGTLRQEDLTPESERKALDGLRRALLAGGDALKSGGGALDAVCAAVRALEDDPIFNAGRGAVFTHDGRNEMDAAVMDGATGKAGAVAGVRTVRNPVELARAVMERSDFVMLAGDGAEEFARVVGVATVDPSYFATDVRWRQLQRALKREQETNRIAVRLSEESPEDQIDALDRKFGTVGAVARDAAGNLAAATSTGGMTNKRYGRIGDCPVVGAGTWAANATCAVSATGHGEYFIRKAVAHDIAARMAYGGAALPDAADAVVLGELKDIGGGGGVIAIDRHGNAALPFNTEGMYRGVLRANGEIEVAIFGNG